jgi:catechol 2,3-dioxygenase-like lactoylglutathione lyase family enzyme
MRILRVSRIVADLARAEAFYRDALGFRVYHRSDTETILRLGTEEVALTCPAMPGAPYPADSRSDDLWFQHLAIVVADMDAAYARLSRHGNWRLISEGGPQQLPPGNGSVRAFKFRDPDGHPLELIWFPAGQGRAVWHDRRSLTPFLGIDHSAIAVAETGRSVAFYQGLGFAVSGCSLNHGPAQDKLDAVPNARVTVTGLRASDSGMGLELLAYDPLGRPTTGAADDIASDWVTLAGPDGTMRDPDGHRLVSLTRDARA